MAAPANQSAPGDDRGQRLLRSRNERTVTLNAGLNFSGGTRRLSTNAGSFLNYEYDPVSTHRINPLNATAVINVHCAAGVTATISLNAGLNFSGGTRRLHNRAGGFLNYEIYKDSGRTVVWNTTNTNSGTATSLAVPISGGFTAYGRIPAGQDVPVATYYDTTQATVNY